MDKRENSERRIKRTLIRYWGRSSTFTLRVYFSGYRHIVDVNNIYFNTRPDSENRNTT